MILSARPPNENALFLPPEIKAFDPNLHKGDRLNYILRANATKKRITGKGNGQRVDVVMNMLYQVPIKKRADERQLLAAKAAETWMINQGATKGYRSLKTVTQGYSTLELGRKRGQGATFGILDLSGEIEILDPISFISALYQGFGRAKAWGCGLMLVRRAQ